jgi:hypothetical protein
MRDGDLPVQIDRTVRTPAGHGHDRVPGNASYTALMSGG